MDIDCPSGSMATADLDTLPDTITDSDALNPPLVADDDVDMDAGPTAGPSGTSSGEAAPVKQSALAAQKPGMSSFFKPRAEANGSSGMSSDSAKLAAKGFIDASGPSASAKGKGKAQDGGLTDEQRQAAAVVREGLPWVEKYRPDTLEDVVSHQDIISTIENFIKKGRLPHLLFYGPPGTGKTSTILALARLIYGPATYRSHILELNASDDRGIDVVRDQIKGFAQTRVLFSKGFKLIILDEADMMTNAAQSALRRVIEQYTKNVRFCILCNYVNKITPAIQSRCTKFRFSPLPEKEVEKKVNQVVDAEKVKLTPDGKEALLKLSKGDMRRALNVLQACHAAYDVVDETAVYNCTGNPHPRDIEAVVASCMRDEFGTAYDFITKLKIDRGLALQDLIAGTYETIETTELPKQSRVYLLDQLATCEYRLSLGGSEKVQLTAMLGAFKIAVELSQKI